MKGIPLGLLIAGLCLVTTVGATPRTTTYTYTPEGLIETLDGPRTDVVDTTRYTYHPRGWLLSQILGEDPGVNTTTYDYDPAGKLVRVTPSIKFNGVYWHD